MSAENGQTAISAWKTILIDLFGFVVVVWSIPVVILLVGAPIALVVALIRWVVA